MNLWRGAAGVAALQLLLAGAAHAQAQTQTQAQTPVQDCRPDPLQGRALYLRGTFNSWNAVETQKLTWACKRWELVTRLAGEHRFKIADEAWSADTDFGRGAGNSLLRRGPELQGRFDGVTRFTLAMKDKDSPELRVENCPAPAPLGETTLYLRGTPNNWAALDDYAFQYSCDAYYLNLKASGRHEFKIADAAWKDASSFGEDGGNFVRQFDGEHTLRLMFIAGRPQLSVGPKSFADPSAATITDPVALSLRFDTRQAAHKSPFGAVTPGTAMRFAVTAARGVRKLTLVLEARRLEGNQELLEYSELARVPMQRSAGAAAQSEIEIEPETETWTASHSLAVKGVYGYWFEAEIGAPPDVRRYVLQNNAEAVYWTREKGNGGAGAVVEAPSSPRSVRRFRQTVYAADFRVPDWAPDIVYYYVFPERFRNGDRSNDPRPGGGRPQDRVQDHDVEVHKDWSGRPYRPNSGDGSDRHHNNDFYGGDLAGLIEKLDYIRDLGANTIYMTPVFKAGSNHKYDTADYREIDPGFGSNADFVRLTQEAARRGLRVILDTSLNHTGSDSVYFNRYGNHGRDGAFQDGRINPASPYAGWYRFDPKQTDPDKQVRGWVGVSSLPELNKQSPALRDFFYRAPDSVTKQWLDRGASGWRMDVAPWVPDDFWREWRAALKAHKPDALTVSETWFDASKYLLGDMFDSTMNYIFRNAVLDYAGGGKAQALMGQLEWLREAYPPQALFAMMNLLSSHDQARSLHHFGWHDDTKDPAVIARAKQRLKLAVLFQMTYPGAPTVYYGDEVGVTGGDDPYNRATYPWADLGGQPDTALLAEFKKLIALRRQHAVLRRGSLDAPLHADAHVVVLARRLGDTWALTATNNDSAPRTVQLTLPAGLESAAFTDVLDTTPGRPAVQAIQALQAVHGRLQLEVPALYGRVLIKR